MADSLNRDTQRTADINTLTQQSIGFTISLASTNSKSTQVDNSLISTAGVLLQTGQRVSFLCDIVDTNYTTQGLLTNGNHSTLTTLINNKINTKIDTNYNNLLTSINNNDATINAVYADTLKRISSLSFIKRYSILEAGINSVF